MYGAQNGGSANQMFMQLILDKIVVFMVKFQVVQMKQDANGEAIFMILLK